MRILVLDEEFPYPPDTGKRIRSFNLYKRLAARHEVHYLAYGIVGSEGFINLTRVGVRPRAVPPQVPPKSGLLFYIRLLLNLFSRHPYIVASHYSKSFQMQLTSICNEIQPHLLICEWTPYAVFVPHLPGVPRVIVAHNIESLIWQRYYENEKNPLKKWYIGHQRKKVAAFERDCFGWAEGATAVSELEAAEIRRINSGRFVVVIENGVDLDYFRPDTERPQGQKLVFVGSMNWRPNQDAVHYFADHIMPLIRRQHPAVEAYVVGQNPPEDILKLGSRPGIKIIGKVDDVRPYIRAAAVYVVPLRIGGGTRLKILEAMAMGKAIVSTRVGAEGLDVVDRREIFLADTAAQFAEGVAALLLDSAHAERMGLAGRALVEKKYSWDQIAGKLESFLVKLAGMK